MVHLIEENCLAVSYELKNNLKTYTYKQPETPRYLPKRHKNLCPHKAYIPYNGVSLL